MTTEKSKHDDPEAMPPGAGAAPPHGKAADKQPGEMPSINEPEGSTIYPANPGGAQKPGPAPGGTAPAHRLDNDPQVKGHDDDDDDDDGGTTRTRTTTVQTKHKR